MFQKVHFERLFYKGLNPSFIKYQNVKNKFWNVSKRGLIF